METTDHTGTDEKYSNIPHGKEISGDQDANGKLNDGTFEDHTSLTRKHPKKTNLPVDRGWAWVILLGMFT